MDLSEINSVLASAENIPVIGGIVRDLQEAVQIMTEIPVNSAVFTEQATNLGQLFNEGTQLANEFNTTLSQLRQSDSWQGPAADDYLGPPGARGPNSGAGGQLAVNMHQILGTVAANKIAHTNSASFIDQVNGLQIFLWGEVVVAVITIGAVVAATASVVGAPADVGLVPAATVETAAATTTAGTIATMTTTTTVLTTSLETVVTEAEAQLAAAYVVAAPLAFGALALRGGAVLVAEIGLALISISLVNASDHGTPTSVDPQPDPLTPDQQAEITRLTQKCPWASKSYIEWLVRHNIAEPSIEQLLAILKPVLPGAEADFEELYNNYPANAMDIALLLRAGFSKEQIIQIFSHFSPRELAALTQRIATALQNGTDKYGCTVEKLYQIFAKIEEYYTSPNAGAQQTVAYALHFADQIIGFEETQYYPDGKRATDFDIVLPNAIIEVKTGSNAAPKQTATQVQFANGKPVIVLGPQITTKAAKKTLTDAGAYAVANSLQELDIILRALPIA